MNELQLLALVAKGLVAELPEELQAQYKAQVQSFRDTIAAAVTNEQKVVLGLAIITMFEEFQALAASLPAKLH